MVKEDSHIPWASLSSRALDHAGWLPSPGKAAGQGKDTAAKPTSCHFFLSLIWQFSGCLVLPALLGNGFMSANQREHFWIFSFASAALLANIESCCAVKPGTPPSAQPPLKESGQAGVPFSLPVTTLPNYSSWNCLSCRERSWIKHPTWSQQNDPVSQHVVNA